MADDYYAFDERSHRLRGETTGKVYRLGDRVEIQVVRVDLDRRQLDFALVDVLERARGAARPAGRGERPPRAGRPGRPAKAASPRERGKPAPRKDGRTGARRGG